jgi:hypothetical protein
MFRLISCLASCLLDFRSLHLSIEMSAQQRLGNRADVVADKSRYRTRYLIQHQMPFTECPLDPYSAISVAHLEVSRVHQGTRLLPQSDDQPAQHDDFPLLHLPLDLLTRHLPTHLPYTSLISLRLSGPEMYGVVPAPGKRRPAHLDECERKAILAALYGREEQLSRRCCAICGSWYPISLFTWGPEKSIIEAADCSGLDNRICRWHRPRFERRVTGDHGATKAGWTLEEACMHCGGVIAWQRCDCKIACQTCWKRDVWCHTRVMDMDARISPEHLLPSSSRSEVAT